MQYAELVCQSNYSFLTGASHPEELVATAHALGYAALALTDECSLAGIVKAHLAARKCGLKLIAGSRFRIADPTHPDTALELVLLAPTRAAWAGLSTLISRGRRRSEKGDYRLSLRDLERGLDECLAIWLPPEDPVALAGPAPRAQGQLLREGFAGRLWLGVPMRLDGEDTARYLALHALAVALDLPMVAANGSLMHTRARGPLADVLTAIRLNTPLARLGGRLAANAERHLRDEAALRALYPAELLAESARIAARCVFTPDELRYEYPRELVPPGTSASAHLRALTESGLSMRWPAGPPPTVVAQIDHELALIAELKYEYFFLTVYDIVQFARAHGILCQGRGSAANSAVCYCLGITAVDPARSQLLFERFLSRERDEPPDIDVDFEHERREEVIQYIYRKYGRDHAALAATVIAYRPRSAIRDVGKALGFEPLLIEHISGALGSWDSADRLRERFRERVPQLSGEWAQRFLDLSCEILRFPRHLSQHVGGFVITRAPIATLVPVENAAMPERTIIQWDKDDLEAMGLLKVDILALGMLTALRKTLDLLNTASAIRRPATLSLADIPAEDPATYEMLSRGDSVGVFQVESRAQMAMLPRLNPRTFYDLVIQVAIVRPGPIQGDMVHPYLRRRNGEEAVEYPDEAVRGVLERTLGVPIFQEQVIKLAMVAAGFSGGEADQLRRAMAAWKKNGNLEHFRAKVVNGMLARGHDREFAERLFRQMQGFGEYGFPESHAASFALLAYASAWLKCHHPAEFLCGLLNSLPMGFYAPAQLVQDARRHGVRVRAPDIDHSDWDSRPEADPASATVRLGLREIAGFGAEAAGRLVAARARQRFANLRDLKDRAGLSTAQLQALVAANAVTRLAAHRHQGHWEARAIEDARPLYAEAERGDAAQLTDGIQLPPPDETTDLLADYASTGLTLARHPMAILRERDPFRRCHRASELPALGNGRFGRVAGVVTHRQKPQTASGVMFLSLEDESGVVNVVIWKDVQRIFRHELLDGRILEIKGTVETRDGVTHLIAGQISDHSGVLPGFAPGSRDFR